MPKPVGFVFPRLAVLLPCSLSGPREADEQLVSLTDLGAYAFLALGDLRLTLAFSWASVF